MSDQPQPETTALKRALLAVKDLRARLDKVERARHEPIAIVGMSCRFPGPAENPAAFWDLLRNGQSAITEVPADRWDIDALFDADQDKPGRMYARHGGFLRRIDQFDARFFGISPREAQSMDPQQRLLLEVAWEALEDAVQSPAALAGTPTGVFVGISASDYAALASAGNPARDLYIGTGTALSIAAGRLAFTLGLSGPAMAVDTACSSALTCVHLAMQSLRNGECHVALAGGVNAIISPEGTILACRGHMLSPDGKCKTFDAGADGYVRGEGCGVIVLKRLADAVASGDRILAVLSGSCVNQDGKSSGLTVPNGGAQEELIRGALADAQLTAEDIDYHEAHGTGTNLGDPIEMRAVQAVHVSRDRSRPLRVGSVKTNIGHLEPAAGIAGLIKVVLSLVHEAIPPHLNLQTPNPHIAWDGTTEVPTSLTPWPRGNRPRRAGVSAFGFSGTNVHVIVEEGPLPEARRVEQTGGASLLTLSARTQPALRQLAASFAERLAAADAPAVEDACYSANAGRSRFDHRLAIVSSSATDLGRQLREIAAGDASTAMAGVAVPGDSPRVAFLYTGQGSQYAGMGRGLFERHPVFRGAIEECDEALGLIDGRRLIDFVYGGETDALLEQTGYAQPALFALQYGLTKVWRSWGVQPAAVMGHSVGEIAAACAAGVLSAADAVALVAARARLMQSLPAGGGMLAATGEVAAIRARVAAAGSNVSVAAVNGADDVVLSGGLDELRRLEAVLAADGFVPKFLKVSHAFHSPLMEPIAAELERVAAGLTFNRPAVRLLSNLTGKPVSAEAPMNAAYWRAHLLSTVQFGPSLEVLRDKHRVFVEIGPHPVLTTLGRKRDAAQQALWLPSLRRGKDDWRQMMESAGALFVRGLELDARGLEQPAAPRKVSLPSYPFERSRCWLDLSARTEAGRPIVQKGHPLLGARIELAGEETRHVWQQTLNTERLPYLRDHCVQGTPVLPATAFAEMAMAAAVEIAGRGVVILRDLKFRAPLALPDGESKSVQLVLIPEGEGAFTFEAYSNTDRAEHGSRWLLHVTGRVLRPLTHPADINPIDLQAAAAHCRTALEGPDFYRRLGSVGSQWGPAFRGVLRLQVGDGEAVSTVDVPASVHADLAPYVFHPALADSCGHLLTATVSLDDSASSGGVMVAGVDEIRVYRTPDSFPLTAHARLRTDAGSSSLLVGDVQVFDREGRLVSESRGSRLWRVAADEALGQSPVDQALYRVEWSAVLSGAAAVSPPAGDGTWMVFSDALGVGRLLAKRLRASGATVCEVVAGEHFQALSSDQVSLSGSRPEDAVALVNSLPRLAGVVHLWALDTPEIGAAGDSRIESMVTAPCRSLLHLVQALEAQGATQRPPLWVVTRGAQAMTEDDGAEAAQAPVWGLARTIAAELPQFGCVCVDLDPAASIEDSSGVVAGAIALDRADDQIAWRGATRLVPRLKRVHAAPLAAAGGIVRANATYLVTGGLGALGLEVARWLAARGARHLVLVGRSGASESAVSVLADLQAGGVAVHVMRADVASLDEMRALVDEVTRTLPPLGGIVHAAGVLHDGALHQLDWAAWRRVMAPKIDGAWNLHVLTREHPLDFFLLFSSVASLFGSAGQGNYAAANAFLDALAHHRRQSGRHALAINFGPWADAGMAARQESLVARWAAQGVSPLPPAIGIDAMERLLQGDLRQAAVFLADWQKLAARLGNAVPPFLSEVVGGRTAAAATGWTREMLTTSEPGVRDRLVHDYVAEQIATVLGLNPAEISATEPITTLGLDSLMAVELRNRFELGIGVDVSVSELLQGPTVDQLSARVGDSLAGADGTGATAGVGVAAVQLVEEGEF